METYIVKRENENDLKFAGEIIGEAYYEDNFGCSKTLTLYKTKTGTFVCSEKTYINIEPTYTTNNALVTLSEAEVINFFGQSDLAKKLYAEAKIENVETVE